MLTNIERIVIIGDELSQSHDEVADEYFTEISLYSDSETKLREIPLDEGDSRIIEKSVSPPLYTRKSLAWFDYLLDNMLYGLNNLPSSIYTNNPRDEIFSVNLEYFKQLYIFNHLTIQTKQKEIAHEHFTESNLTDLGTVVSDIISSDYSKNTKNTTLIFIWLGINDLKQNNKNIKEINEETLANDLFIQIKNLIYNGFKNFCILSTPNTPLTAKNISTVHLFGMSLNLEMEELKKQFSDININLVDTDNILEGAEQNFSERMQLTKTSQEAIARNITDEVISRKYSFIAPEEILIGQYRKKYHEIYQADKNKIMGFMIKEPGINYKTASLCEVFQHAKDDHSSRTFKTLKNLGWIDDAGNCISSNPIIQTKWQNQASPLDLSSTYS